MDQPQRTLDDEKLEFVNRRSAEIGKELHLINMRFNGNFEKVAYEIGRILSNIEFTTRILNEQVEHLLKAQESGAQSMHDTVEHFVLRCHELEERTNKLNEADKLNSTCIDALDNRIKRLETAPEAQSEKPQISMPKGDTKQ